MITEHQVINKMSRRDKIIQIHLFGCILSGVVCLFLGQIYQSSNLNVGGIVMIIWGVVGTYLIVDLILISFGVTNENELIKKQQWIS